MMQSSTSKRFWGDCHYDDRRDFSRVGLSTFAATSTMKFEQEAPMLDYFLLDNCNFARNGVLTETEHYNNKNDGFRPDLGSIEPVAPVGQCNYWGDQRLHSLSDDARAKEIDLLKESVEPLVWQSDVRARFYADDRRHQIK